MPGDIVGPTNITIPQLIRGSTNIVTIVLVFILLAMLIYSGYLRVTSGGDPEKVEQSTKSFISAVIGFIIIVVSALVVNILGAFLGTGTLIGT